MTIEEMAEKYVNDAYSHPVDKNVGKADFILGANAVLKEIETRIEMGKHASMQTDKTILESVEMAINELKGKE